MSIHCPRSFYVQQSRQKVQARTGRGSLRDRCPSRWFPSQRPRVPASEAYGKRCRPDASSQRLKGLLRLEYPGWRADTVGDRVLELTEKAGLPRRV